MFEGLRRAFSGVTRGITEKHIGAGDVDSVIEELEIALLNHDIAVDVIDDIRDEIKKTQQGESVSRKQVGEYVRECVIRAVSRTFERAGTLDLVERARSSEKRPFIILFVGINGTGKTTTLAKVAHMMAAGKISLVIAAADTFRAGAIEQLREHANRLGLKIVAQNYGSDPAAVARDAVLYAVAHKVDCVLVDTAGRMQTNKNLMDQISKINGVIKPDLRVFVGDSLAGNDTVNQAREFHERIGIDAAILTKADSEGGGGAALSVVRTTSAPIAYLGTGQEYGDLGAFDRRGFLDGVFGPGAAEIADRPQTEEIRR